MRDEVDLTDEASVLNRDMEIARRHIADLADEVSALRRDLEAAQVELGEAKKRIGELMVREVDLLRVVDRRTDGSRGGSVARSGSAQVQSSATGKAPCGRSPFPGHCG